MAIDYRNPNAPGKRGILYPTTGFGSGIDPMQILSDLAAFNPGSFGSPDQALEATLPQTLPLSAISMAREQLNPLEAGMFGVAQSPKEEMGIFAGAAARQQKEKENQQAIQLEQQENELNRQVEKENAALDIFSRKAEQSNKRIDKLTADLNNMYEDEAAKIAASIMKQKSLTSMEELSVQDQVTIRNQAQTLLQQSPVALAIKEQIKGIEQSDQQAYQDLLARQEQKNKSAQKLVRVGNTYTNVSDSEESEGPPKGGAVDDPQTVSAFESALSSKKVTIEQAKKEPEWQSLSPAKQKELEQKYSLKKVDPPAKKGSSSMSPLPVDVGNLFKSTGQGSLSPFANMSAAEPDPNIPVDANFMEIFLDFMRRNPGSIR